MSKVDVLPEVKQIIGAMLFAAKHPVSAAQMRRVFQQVAENHGGATSDFAQLKEKDIKAAVEELSAELERSKVGMAISEVAKGYRLENEVSCGKWVRELLDRGKPQRLSRPALETLAIIAYRQPCVRSEIEAVRGVAVDQILRNLMEMQLVRIVGRREMPGRPMLFGTTQKFLEYFGINTLNDLPGVEELRRIENLGGAGSRDQKGREAVSEESEGNEETSGDEAGATEESGKDGEP